MFFFYYTINYSLFFFYIYIYTLKLLTNCLIDTPVAIFSFVHRSCSFRVASDT